MKKFLTMIAMMIVCNGAMAQARYYLNIPQTQSADSSVSAFFATLAQPFYAPPGTGIGRLYYKGADKTIFSANSILRTVTDTSVIAFWHTPVAFDYCAYVIVIINSVDKSVSMTQVNRYGIPFWFDSFTLSSDSDVFIDTSP